MGAGAFGHVTTAMVCAASSFGMQITDPRSLLDDMDIEFFKTYRGDAEKVYKPVTYFEPGVRAQSATKRKSNKTDSGVTSQDGSNQIQSKIITLGDFIDTDALSPGDTLTTCVTDEDFGKHVLKHTHPDFREKVHGGQQVVVAGHAMGVGSSRETAVQALKGKVNILCS